ncbi:MAG: protein-export chaperone SecB [Syntrophomonadaceae bacterium]|nr:protein-export chaperone SecB [Syntrophomonadaceae bacterium]
MSIDAKLYKSFIESLDLEEIFLDSLKVKNYHLPKPRNLTVKLEPEFGISKIFKDSFFASAKFQVIVSDDKERKAFVIDARFRLLYNFESSITIDDEMQEKFMATTLPVNSWPFAREIISSMTTRMGYPSLLIAPFKVY